MTQTWLDAEEKCQDECFQDLAKDCTRRPGKSEAGVRSHDYAGASLRGVKHLMAAARLLLDMEEA